MKKCNLAVELYGEDSRKGQNSRGRFPSENVFTPKPGPTAYSCRQGMKESPLILFQLFIDETMLRLIQKYTIHHAHLDDVNFNCPLKELEKFIGLPIARGILERKNTPIKQLSSKEWDHPIFVSTLSRNHFETVMKHLRQWFLNLLEVPNPASFMQALTEPFLKIQKIFINELEPKVNYASVAHKIILFKEIEPTKHELHTKTNSINIYDKSMRLLCCCILETILKMRGS